ncbi:MAG: anion transporter, partial [Saccharolobus sp.]
MLLLAIVAMIITYGLIISRGITRIPPWVAMLFGGVLMIIFNVLTLQEAIDSINMEVILFLITLFIFASAL